MVRGACVLYMSMLMWCLCSIYEHAHAVHGACVLYMSMLMQCLCSIYEHAHAVLVFYI